MQYQPDAPIRFYQVKTWRPPTGDHKWGGHYVFGVVTRSAVEAVALVAAAYPEHRIDAVNSTAVTHLIDSKLNLPISAPA